jgi:hypothetical protein
MNSDSHRSDCYDADPTMSHTKQNPSAPFPNNHHRQINRGVGEKLSLPRQRREQSRSEDDVSSNLHEPRCVLSCGTSEVAIGEICVDSIQVGTVKEIEELKAHLKRNPLRDRRLL